MRMDQKVVQQPSVTVREREPPSKILLADRIGFYFKNGNVCRLCDVAAKDPFEHLSTGHDLRSHTIREVLADSLMPDVVAGVPAVDLARDWPRRLLDAPGLQRGRIRHLVPDTLLARAAAVKQLLRLFSEWGMLDDALAPSWRVGDDERFVKRQFNTVDFERGEFIGDSMWGANISARVVALFPDRDWLSPAYAWSWSIMRDNIESNSNLTQVFDVLQLDSLVADGVKLSGEKPFADLLEAVLGVLYTRVWELQTASAISAARMVAPCGDRPAHAVVALLEHCREEIYDIATLCFLYNLVSPVVPMVREMLMGACFPAIAPAVQEEPHAYRARTAGFTFRATTLHDSSRPVVLDLTCCMPETVNLASQPKAAVQYDALDLLERLDVKSPSRSTPHLALTAGAVRLPCDHAAQHALVLELRPALLDDAAVMERRMHPVDQPFAINSGFVPQVVLDADAKRLAESARKSGWKKFNDPKRRRESALRRQALALKKD
jgi:hypothetical protein